MTGGNRLNARGKVTGNIIPMFRKDQHVRQLRDLLYAAYIEENLDDRHALYSDWGDIYVQNDYLTWTRSHHVAFVLETSSKYWGIFFHH